MSLYTVILSLDADADDGLGPPYAFGGSHLLPKPTDARDGWVSFAAIPARRGADGKSLVDFLRLDVSPNDEGEPYVTVVLDRQQVALIVERLNDWLSRRPEDE